MHSTVEHPVYSINWKRAETNLVRVNRKSSWLSGLYLVLGLSGKLDSVCRNETSIAHNGDYSAHDIRKMHLESKKKKTKLKKKLGRQLKIRTRHTNKESKMVIYSWEITSNAHLRAQMVLFFPYLKYGTSSLYLIHFADLFYFIWRWKNLLNLRNTRYAINPNKWKFFLSNTPTATCEPPWQNSN